MLQGQRVTHTAPWVVVQPSHTADQPTLPAPLGPWPGVQGGGEGGGLHHQYKVPGEGESTGRTLYQR